MLNESIAALNIKPEGIYVDLTFGGGGHTQAILAQLTQGKVWAFDQDPDALAKAQSIQDARLYFVQGNFRFFSKFLAAHHITKVDGILADLGVSSWQLDAPERGFAARLDVPLDMRMHKQGTFTAATLLNTYTAKQLEVIFSRYGDVYNAKLLAKHLIQARKKKPFCTTKQLRDAIRPCVPRYREYQYYAKIFQALRIVVNDELNALREMLLQVPGVLKPHGHFVTLTYHSGEDKLVKNFIKTGNLAGKVVHDFYGNVIRPLTPLYRKVIRPSVEEVEQNNRARSARLRAAKTTQSS